jgi:hypothetical protein
MPARDGGHLSCRLALRSRHLPLLPWPGSAHSNLQIRVRFWSDPSFDENGEVGSGDPVDLVAQRAHRGRLADEGRAPSVPARGSVHPRALDFDREGRQLAASCSICTCHSSNRRSGELRESRNMISR